jgi:hypothetical protein
MGSIFEDLAPIPELSEGAERAARTGKALVVVAHGKPWVLAWQVGTHLYELMTGHKDGFAPEDEGFDMGPVPEGDGVYVCELGWVDDGPGDWPGSREVLPSLVSWRKATPEEWGHHLKNEWPWEPEEGWA